MPQFSETNPIRVVIVGGGISGIAQAIRIKEALGNKAKITVLEKAASPGGIWRDSKWPGAGVDVPIHLYSLYSDLKPDWTRLYAEQPEVLAYWLSLIEKHNLGSSFCFNSEFTNSYWSNSTQSHTVTVRDTNTKDSWSLEAEVIVGANGPLSTPLIPELPGLKGRFKGHYFHNLRWDDKYDFEGKKIVVVGSGSSAIQFIPGLAARPGVRLTQIIRSGGYFVPKINTEYSPAIKFAFRWIPGLQRLYRFTLFLESNDRWRARNEEAVRPTPTETGLIKYLADTAPAKYFEILKPTYPFGCKRPAFDHGWLKSLHRDNVELISSSITEFEENGLRLKDGRFVEADVVIFATGSNVAEHGVGINIGVHGEGGKELKRYWEEIGGPQAYLGVAVPGFPNLFNVLGPNGIAGSWGYTIGINTAFIARLIASLVNDNLSSIQPTLPAFRQHNLVIREKLATSTMNSQLCSNWWRVGGKGLISVPNWQTGFGLERSVRHIKWVDWEAREKIDERIAGDQKSVVGEFRQVDMARRIWWRTVRKVIEGAVITSTIVALARNQGWWSTVLGTIRA